VGRRIPPWIGRVDVPTNRETTRQLLFCWAQLLDEVANVKTMLRGLDGHLNEDEFLVLAQEISSHLSGVIEERKMEKKRTDLVWVGRIPNTNLVGRMNVGLAQTLHVYFDEPDYKIKARHPPIADPSLQL
jgi:hypothetical protein